MLDFSVTFIITLINITILFFILRAILFKPVTKFMEERERKVQASIDQADKDRAEAKRLLADYEKKLQDAEAQANEILKIASENALRQAERIVSKSRKEAENIMASAEKQIETERQVAIAKFRLEASALVIAATSKLAAKEISGDENHRYVNMLIEELSKNSQHMQKRV
jgi:F-type H+-transporting ATPase subunit b